MLMGFCIIPEKRYANLCALCENPAKCDYPDKYSGYDGSIKCLVENGGDVAFTKVIFVNRYFGVSLINCLFFKYFFMTLLYQHNTVIIVAIFSYVSHIRTLHNLRNSKLFI